MTKTRVLALLTVIALLAAMPLSVALGQRLPPDLIQGTVMLDNMAPPAGAMVVAMVETEVEGEDGETTMEMMEVGSATVMADGGFLIKVEDNSGNTATFSLTVGEGEDMMKYDAMAAEDIMIGTNSEGLMLHAATGTVAPTKTPAQEQESLRGRTGPRGPAGEQGPAGEMGPAGADGADGKDGKDGAPGADGAAGARGPAGPAGADGSDGMDGSDGADGSDGSDGAAGPQGPAGNDGAMGPAGPAGAEGASGGGGLAIVALIIAIVAVVAAGGAFIAGRQSG